MPLIANYISRFRTQSQSTAATSNTSQSGSHSTATTVDLSTPVKSLGPDRLSTDDASVGTVLKPIEELVHKIHPDLNALISEAEALPAEASGLPPPRRKNRSAGQLVAKKPEPVSDNDKAGDRHDSQIDDSAGTSASPRSPFLSRILSTPILGGSRSSSSANDNDDSKTVESDLHWSTFGRRRLRMPQVGEFGSLRRRQSGSKSPNSKSSQRRLSRTSASTFSNTRPLSQAPTAPSSTGSHPSQGDSPVGTLSSSGSKRHSQNSHPALSRRTVTFPEPIPDDERPSTPVRSPAVASSFSPDSVDHAVASPSTHPFLDDSTNTFGRHTTPTRPAITKGGQHVVFFTPSRTSTPPPLERLYRRDPPNTYPPRSSKRTLENIGSVSFPSINIGAAKDSLSKTRAEDIFLESGNETSRRISADWSAAESLISQNSSGESWPASVSREMVKLSLGSPSGRNNAVGPEEKREDIPETKEMGALQASGSKNPTIFGSIGQDRRLFLRATRKKTAPSIAETLASASQQSDSVELLRPAFPVASVNKIRSGTHSGPRVSVTEPSPVTASGSRMGTLSDPGPSPLGQRLDDDVPASIGKRKMNESEDELPMAQIGTKSILLTRRESSNRPSDASHAPSSFRQPKRIRLSTPPHSFPHDQSLQSMLSHQARPGSPNSRPSSSLRTTPNANSRSSSQTSIPLRAIISPRPPSIDRRSMYHMRDPDVAPPLYQSSQWRGSARKTGEDGRRMFPLQGWAFIVGFIIFPLWWLAAILPIRWGWGRRIGSQDGKGVWTEEELASRETLEYDVAYAWRRRCRIISLLGLFVYVPIIVLLVVFLPRT